MEKDTLDRLLVDAIVNRKYPQNALLAPNWFLQYLNKRANSHNWERTLERLDKEGLFMPLLRVEHESSHHLIVSRNEDGSVNKWHEKRLIEEQNLVNDANVVEVFHNAPDTQESWRKARDDGRIVIRRESNFSPWNSTVSDTNRQIRCATNFYHPYQAFVCLDALRSIKWSINLLDLSGSPEHATELYQNCVNHLAKIKSEFTFEQTIWKQQLLLLLLIEDKYLPPIRESVHYKNYSFRDGYDWGNWAEAFDPRKALSLSGMSIDEVAKFHQDMAFQGRVTDPNFRWFPLIRHMEYEQRRQAEKQSLLAWDYHELTEMLGDFLHNLTDQKQLLPDDVTFGGGAWKTKTYNFPAEEIDYKRGNALPGILRHYGLDPRNRVWIFVEGETEEEFIKEWFGKYNIALSSSRIVLVNLRSNSGLSSPIFMAQAQSAREQDAAVFVIVDEDADRTKREADLQQWIDKGFIHRIFSVSALCQPEALPIGGLIWEPCFEDANFTFDELAVAWKQTLYEKHGRDNVNEEGFARVVALARTNNSYGSNIKTIEKLTIREQRSLLMNGKASFNKVDMGRILAKLYGDKDKPIVQLLVRIHHIASLDTVVYRPSGEQQVTESGEQPILEN